MAGKWLVSSGTATVEIWESSGHPVVLTSAPEIGYGVRTDDVSMPGGDGIIFGADELDGSSILLTLDIGDLLSESAAVSALQQVRQVWRADQVRRTPGAVSTLEAPSGRLTFGRPRRFSHDDTYRKQGLIRATCDFTATSDLWFSGVENEASVTLVPSPGGGLIAPLQSPLATTETSDRSTAFTVTGEVSTCGIYEVEGPLIDPVVEVVGLFRLEYRGTLAFDEVLTIDTRPHVRTARRNGASVSLAPTSTRMSQTALPPGRHELVLRGASEAGTARVTARWRDAFTTF
ncbi:hypothetical protein [Mycetocola miduiensis]|uniref:Uncharacterized protein n=1 Tax=Mycetocola miduiensis TaxID=995034 RepID=A0A1I5AUJ8_9MICO|nr:hypothetical protein [Mycetocola miduiensis]SFN66062.1 hypothetical protein SAMN05216219_1546 [Mycetocola miduiensis]